MSFLEVGMGLYFIGVIGFAVRHEIYFPIPFLMLFCLGFFYVGWMSLFQGRLARLRLMHSEVEAAAAD